MPNATTCTLILGLALPIPAAWAQGGTGGIEGWLIDRVTRAPITGAEVFVLGYGGPERPDAEGRFRRTGLKGGYYIIEVRSVGYARATWEVQVRDNEVVAHTLELEPIATLPPVVVEGERKTWFRDFDERRAMGRGQFLTREEIDRRPARSLGELLRPMNGMRMSCIRNSTECSIRMTRWVNCVPTYYQDGFHVNAATAERFLPVDIHGIEVYHVSEVPVEFQRTDLRCGVIVIWTRRGPPPR